MRCARAVQRHSEGQVVEVQKGHTEQDFKTQHTQHNQLDLIEGMRFVSLANVSNDGPPFP